MSSPIDLTTPSAVRGWLGMASGGAGNASGTGQVSTTSSAPIPAGTQTVTPGTMANIVVGTVLAADDPATEYVMVTAVTGTTFTATFSLSHAATNVILTDTTDILIGRLITAASQYIMRRTRRVNWDSSIPTQSTFCQQVSFNEWYDGNGNSRLFLRFFPIVSVTSLTVNGIAIPASTAFSVPGYVIDQNGKSLVVRSATQYQGGWFGSGNWYVNNFGPVYNFARGVQNINVQYTAGYSSVPYDLEDACVQMVGFTYRKSAWIGQIQVSQAENIGTIRYVEWEIPPIAENTIQLYTPASIV